MYHDCFVDLLLAFITNRVILGKSVGGRGGEDKKTSNRREREGGRGLK